MLRLTFWAILFFAPPLAVIYWGWGSLIGFIAGFVLAFVSLPLCGWLERQKYFTRTTASLLVSLGGSFLFLMVLALLIPTVLVEIFKLVQEFPAYLRTFTSWLTPRVNETLAWLSSVSGIDLEGYIGKSLQQLINSVKNLGGADKEVYRQLGGALGNVAGWVEKISTSTLAGLMIIILTPWSFYVVLRYWDFGLNRIDRFISDEFRSPIMALARDMDRIASGYLRGVATLLLVLSAYYAIGLLIFGVKYALGLGVFAGLISVIPVVGAVLSGTIILLVTFLQFSWEWQLYAVITLFIAGQALENFVLSPRLVGAKVGLHPLVAVLALLLCSQWFGILGLILALPITATAFALWRILLLWTRASTAKRQDG